MAKLGRWPSTPQECLRAREARRGLSKNQPREALISGLRRHKAVVPRSGSPGTRTRPTQSPPDTSIKVLPHTSRNAPLFLIFGRRVLKSRR